MPLYFVSYVASGGVLGYTHVATKKRIDSFNIGEVQRSIESGNALKSVVILNYKRLWFTRRKKG